MEPHFHMDAPHILIQAIEIAIIYHLIRIGAASLASHVENTGIKNLATAIGGFVTFGGK